VHGSLRPAVIGPTFRFVNEISWDDLLTRSRIGPPTGPLLVKGAVKAWPAWQRWSFEALADLTEANGRQTTASFQNGLVEQGMTRAPVIQPVAPYLRDLSRQSTLPASERSGLLSEKRRGLIGRSDTFTLDWSYMNSFKADKVYLAQWNILDAFPELRKDFAIRTVWPGWRWTWEFVFMGPSQTVTGLHFDFPNNWFCQVRGTKEVILFPPDQTPNMCRSKKYDWGATLSDIDISRVEHQRRELPHFNNLNGLYARVEAGDALFIPSRTWHAVVALEPSISLAVFGLTPAEIVVGGGAASARHGAHMLRLYRWGNCTCHKMSAKPKAAA